ncbi:xylulokinase [Bosea caraganae]|uniref:Xylulose kinase n=1 Tax=Bosea caraganae TaxID=2763117 RepID=A0A370L4V3_9HYPH|nr:xylulokinase [Bosea caraganae]RDJ22290.1 xylulokinase [Bosea caraganae]RDJ23776.1 xylulokinase [Bosea caraganae]
MPLVLGIDLGTSGVKSVLVDERDHIVAEAAAPLSVSRPQPLWCEQEPEDWWQAVAATLDALAAAEPKRMAAIGAIGLSGQMLGVTCLDANDRPLRPALLWNDGRATAECAEIEAAVPDFAGLVGCRAMVGFPAPKLLWLARHEPDTLAKTQRILLPKDYVRLRLTGVAASDHADASATLLMDTLAREWSSDLLSACGVDRRQLPALIASHEVSGGLRPELARRWGMAAQTPVVGGAGDNMCGGVGAGIVAAGMASISLGTSGVYFLANDRFLPARGQGMHTHRHAVEGLFAQNGCILSAGAALSWVAGIVGASDIPKLIREVEAAGIPISETPVFTPYLTGERTPHDDAGLTGAFSGLSMATTRLHLVQAVLEGVALALGDCHRALLWTGAKTEQVALVGGGSHSPLWANLVASAIGMPLTRSQSAAVGPALGAARLARQGIGGPLLADAGDAADDSEIQPIQAMAEALAAKRARFERHLALR